MSISDYSIYTKKHFFCFSSTRLKFTDANQKTYDVAIKNSSSSKRFFATTLNGENISINVNSFRKNVGCNKKVLKKVIKETKSLEDVMAHLLGYMPLAKCLKDFQEKNYQITAYKIHQYVEKRKKELFQSWQYETDCIQENLKNGRTLIVCKDGSKLNFYVHLGSIGSGSFKKVYRYYNFQNQTDDIAVSVQKIQNKHKLKQAVNEIKYIEKLRTVNNVIKLKYFFSANSEIISIMERYDGSLKEGIHRFNPYIRCRIFQKVAIALNEIHKQGIVHRDLKLTNILYRLRGNLLDIELIDFGLACKTTNSSSLTRKVGSRYFMAPEVIGKDEKEEPLKIDLWSLGVILYKLYTLKTVPFSRKVSTALKNSKLDEQQRKAILIKAALPFIENLRNSEDPWLNLAADLLEPDPKKRLSAQQCCYRVNELLSS